jgi:phage tail tape-measure protein
MKTAGSVNVEIGATFAGTFKSAFGAAESQISRLGGTVRALDGRLQNVAGFRKLTEDTKQAGYAWQAAKVKAEQLAQALAAAENPTKKQAAELRRAQAAAERAGEAFARSRERLADMRKGLTDAGISTKNLADDQKKLERQLEATQNRMTALAGVANSGVGKAFGEVGSKFRSLSTQAAVAGAGLGYFFKKNFVDVASEFEKFKTILETTEGSAAGADKAMKWVSDFAAKTPFELAEVTQAFVKLRAYGLDPTNGLLRTLGDTGAAMGKPVMQAVEAIADAVTGENERLKEFGIKGSKKGGQVTYEFTDKAGRQRTKTVDAENRKMIESTLTAIWNEKYGGAMDKLSGTWAGMVSNVKDQWARFANNTMNAGLFEWMKGRLSDLLGTLDRMAANGELQTWAERTGKSLVTFAENAWALGKSIVDTTARIAAFVGGWENLGMIIVALKFAPLIVSIGQLGAALFSAAGFLMMFATGTATAGAAWLAFGTGLVSTLAMIGTAFKTLAAFMLTNPIGIALTLLSFAGFVLWQNWETVKGGLVAVWETIKETAIAAFDAIKSAVGAVIDWLAEKTAWIFQTVDKVKAAASSIGDGIGNAWQGAKNLVGAGQGPGGSTMTGAPAAAAVVPAARSGPTINQTNQPQYNITVQGSASDPAATAKAIRAEMDRREREKAANRRGMLTDALGY